MKTIRREGELELRLESVHAGGDMHPQIVRWRPDGGGSCTLIAHWSRWDEGPELRLVGGRPFEDGGVDATTFWKLAEEGQRLAERIARGEPLEEQPQQVTAVLGDEVLRWMEESGIVPPGTQRVVIEAARGSFMVLYIEAVHHGAVRVVPATVRGVQVQTEIHGDQP